MFISVDVETAGPIPGRYSLLTLGACVIGRPDATFSVRVQPQSRDADPDALRVTGLSLDDLARTGLPPQDAMGAFATWIDAHADGAIPVFVGLNAAFDWSFVNYYFHTYSERNPFGFAPLDIKSMFFGAYDCSWRDTRSSRMTEVLGLERTGTHEALDDALFQGELFALLQARRS
ncbi:3'-5' exonuclease [uncultured Deinococcus sp.]|uniref:3'-5' exonuclease n=1 Tax=uncultured Deinococcus sp. TaxID=158789 RepID=UPI0025E8EF05|nr:3'-5' exonuclease [uncultured Deinococcus sp.]